MIVDNKTYTNLPEYIQVITPDIEDGGMAKKRGSKYHKGYSIYNTSGAFDIETSSFYDADGRKTAIMYCWQFSVNGHVFIGRKWTEFIDLLNYLRNDLGLCESKRFAVWVHNLAHEFQYIRHLQSWDNVFSMESRKVVKALTDGIEFKDSLVLSGKSLENTAKDIYIMDIKKMKGDLDYRLTRHSETPLTEEEIGYCRNDVLILNAYIEQKIKEEGDILGIPMTATGYVRRDVQKAVLYDKDGKYTKSAWKIHSMTLEVEEYAMLKEAFTGGFTHGNSFHIGKTWKVGRDGLIKSNDETSAYPTVMIAKKFPMSKGECIIDKERLSNKEWLRNTFKKYFCVMDVTFKDIDEKLCHEHPLSASKCRIDGKHQEDNGRLVFVHGTVRTTITVDDLKTISEFYKIGGFRVNKMYRYRLGYLPKEYVGKILEYYEAKTTLKGVKGQELIYGFKKSLLNSLYGMACTDIVRAEYLYTTDWEDPIPPNMEEQIQKYNESRTRFLSFPWGVAVVSYARRNLFKAIKSLGMDYIYADTDSVKYKNPEKHESWFSDYNADIVRQLEKAMDHHGFDRDRIRPKTVKGEEKPLGVWDDDGTYYKFKTLGAKRYMYMSIDKEKDGSKHFALHTTVAGCNKSKLVDYLMQGKPFESFDFSLEVPEEYAGRLISCYIDEVREGTVTDYTGKPGKYEELSSVHFEPSAYQFDENIQFQKFCAGRIDTGLFRG